MMLSRLRSPIGILLAVLLVAGVLGGVALATTSDDTFYACEKNGKVKAWTIRVNQVPKCWRGSHVVSWNAEGPQGPQGEPGAGLPTDCNDGDISRWNATSEQWECSALLTELETLLANVTLDGDNLVITGMNLHIVNGTGDTQEINGLGNVIIGYNESRDEYPEVWYPRPRTDDRTGSHMLVVGSANNYSEFGGIVTGFFNTANGAYTSVSGGERNTASGEYASVCGGSYSIASGVASSVSGGRGHLASATWSSVSGGWDNQANGFASSVSGGYRRSVSGESDWRAGSLLEDQ